MSPGPLQCPREPTPNKISIPGKKIILETGSHCVVLAGLELTTQPRVASHSESHLSQPPESWEWGVGGCTMPGYYSFASTPHSNYKPKFNYKSKLCFPVYITYFSPVG